MAEADPGVSASKLRRIAVPLTIGETVEQMHASLRDYIEATYHVSHAGLVAQRHALLDQPGVIHQRPFLESTPKYETGDAFADLELPMPVLEMFGAVTSDSGGLPRLIHDPPYEHQATSVKQSLTEGRSLVVITGTGSGKTECFLLPILGKLAREAHDNAHVFGTTPAVRALVLYPMNALVNDQLGRLRLLFGDQRIVDKFMEWSGRPARFARYTSRTLYPGVRSEDKDKTRLKAIGDYYVHYLELACGPPSSEQQAAQRLVSELKERGKWPAKPDLLSWYKKGSRWRDQKTGEFRRCVTLPDEPELFTRHEVHAAPPDVLVTNYSMLEYMLMRPLERPIFDQTKAWLRNNPDERLLLVLDEAHLYRGAAGAEVALLVRRLRARLGVPSERLQVICTSASFHNRDYASAFGAQLTGKEPGTFVTVPGNLHHRDAEGPGLEEDAVALCSVDLDAFYAAESDDERLDQVKSFLEHRSVVPPWVLGPSLHDALVEFPPMARLINLTMTAAQPVDTLGAHVFEGVASDLASRALTTLIALGSLARQNPSAPGLLPCRVHSFYRGLAGLWVCLDSTCTALEPEARGGPCGKLFSQPRDACECGARVLELYTCRNCGSAYARAYTDDLDAPDFLWAEAGGEFRTQMGAHEELEPLDLLLEQPVVGAAEPADYDLVTGRLNPLALGERVRQVFVRRDRSPAIDDDAGEVFARLGEFVPCGVCGKTAAFGRSSVQDHQTKGDQPFQALIAKQLQIQPPSAPAITRLAPLRGRKVLIFSDSRQTAARLAPNLQAYSTQDALRPLVVTGFARLLQSPLVASLVSLEDLYLAVLIAAKQLRVRLRPQLKDGESFHAEEIVEQRIDAGVLESDTDFLELFVAVRSESPPEALLRGITKCLTDQYYGLESLALASIIERSSHAAGILALPDVDGVATTPGQKLALARAWLRCWQRAGFWLSRMPHGWWQTEVRAHSGQFRELDRRITDTRARRVFKQQWLPELLQRFTQQFAANKHRLKGSELSLQIAGDWAYCQGCRTPQRSFPGSQRCVNCGQESAAFIAPDSDPVFVARKGYYRASTVDALSNPSISPMALIAAEHTAQLNVAQSDEVFSKAEENELLFQDVDLGPDEKDRDRPAIDVLSCTTTMEVGIDIGTLGGVSLRNMPPARANYQQRAGRAGRRGNTVATVTAFGSADSHDEHYFTNPHEMIRGDVDDPTLTLNNAEIIRRHMTAYLLQRYHQEKLPNIAPEDQPHLFAVLGSVADFKKPDTVLNRNDFAAWLASSAAELESEVSGWLPGELAQEASADLLAGLVDDTLAVIDTAISHSAPGSSPDEHEIRGRTAGEGDEGTGGGEETTGLEIQDEEGEEQPGRDPASENLLDRLLYTGVLPRYAFPTDVATFYVFDLEKTTRYRPAFHFTPSQGLPVALSQYAPGKEVWIGGKLWTSGAIYSPMKDDRFDAWQRRRLYYECGFCRYASTVSLADGTLGEFRDCEACGSEGTFGPARYWLRPPGFSHPVDREAGTSPDDQPVRSYATRAKLTAPTPADKNQWSNINQRLRVHHMRQHLLVTNRGPRTEGYTYCTLCGRIEPSAAPHGTVGSAHRKPFPDDRDPNCPGGRATKGLTLGTDFITDVLLVSINVEPPLTLAPGLLATDVALRTVSEALTKASCDRLGIEPQELQAEYRPALTDAGRDGREAEVYVYDTLPGGAGFARRVGDLGIGVFERALKILEACAEDCDRSCYRCLRSYKNKFEHDLLDRQVGASLLRYALAGDYPALDPGRLAASTDLLFQDLQRQNLDNIVLKRNHTISPTGLSPVTAPIYVERQDGLEFVVGLHSPLTPDDPPDDGLRELKEFCPTIPVFLCNEIVVRRNLPRATSQLIGRVRQR